MRASISKKKVSIITNIPAPYRCSVFERINSLDVDVIFCASTESNRKWVPQPIRFSSHFLKGSVRKKKDGYNFVYNNPGIWNVLSRTKPSIVITTGFNPTHLYAFIWAKLHGAKHICMTDGTIFSESHLTSLHRWVRRLVFIGSHAFIAASKGGVALYKSYGINEHRIFRSQLCADNLRFLQASENSSKSFDVCFSGQFHERKLPFFFVDVCAAIQARKGSCRALLMGDGPLREQLLGKLTTAGIEFVYAGFVQQDDLPRYYASAKLLLFPTLGDCWGVVANEAMAAGTPLITTPYAGVADELVVDGETGYVRDINVDAWADVALRVLQDNSHRNALVEAGKKLVAQYNFKEAAEGIEAACFYVK